MQHLKIGGIVSNSIKIGLKNIASLIGAVILWILTIWIPYLNVGTTIAMLGIVVAMSKGKVISPTEIFSAKYRRNMGEFFLLIGFLNIGITAGYAFVIIPGIVISLAWGQAIYLLIDKGYNPTEAITVSNRITYGKKWTIFFGTIILAVVCIIAIAIVFLILSLIADILGKLAAIVGCIVFFAVMMGCAAYIYGELSKQIESAD